MCTAILLVSVAGVMKTALVAQNDSSVAFTLDQVLNYPFPDNLVASPRGATVAWTFNERGARNIYVADEPELTARRITPYMEDDGQELTNLSFSPDGKTIVYVRGGDHGANWPADGNLMPNPSGSPTQPKMQVWAISIGSGGSSGSIGSATLPKLIGEGDEPTISPFGNRVAFVKDRRIWIAPLDGSKPAEAAFFAKGSSESPAWSPDGRRLAFVSNRDDHSFIGLFTDVTQPIRYLAPSTSRDSNPVWSPDGREIAFVRQPGRGGVPKSLLLQQPAPWAIWVADTEAPDRDAPNRQLARESWKSGETLVDSIPRTAGGVNLHWAADDHLVFLSYQDGWPHLYSIRHPGEGGKPKLLTPGAFMVEHASLTADRRAMVYNANTGSDRADINRRHLFQVAADGSSRPIALTTGTGIEWSPVTTSDSQTVAFLA